MSRSILGLSMIALFALGGCSSDSTTSAPASSSGGGPSAGGASTGNGGAAMSSGGSSSSNGGSSSSNGGSTGNGGSTTGNGGSTTGSGGSSGTGGSTPGAGGFPLVDAAAGATYDQVKGWIDAYATAHPGRAGDINANGDTSAAANQLRSLCGANQLPVIPKLAWEYGGNDHAWINPDQAPLVICVYIAVNPSTDHWKYDTAADHITADVYVLFPDQNPCKAQTGKDQVLGCLGDSTNIEILVDTSSIHDGADVGLQLANSSTDLMLILSDGSKVLLATVA